MRATTFMCAVLLVMLAAACTTQRAGSNESASTGIDGRWTGEYQVGRAREPISVDLRWEQPNLTGTVRSGFRSMPLTKASYAPDTGKITMEFDAEGPGGRTVHYVIDGKVNGKDMSGTWSHDDQRGDFHVTRQ